MRWRSNIWRTGSTMGNAEAHRILDLARAGVAVHEALITAALVATGDLTTEVME